jgi:hypothetical protein
MKYIAIVTTVILSACAAPMDADLAAHLEAERDFHTHQTYIESIYTKYDPEYIDDCLYHGELVCEFE